MDINACVETTKQYYSIAFYSHLVPVFISVMLAFFILVKTKYSLLSKIFAFFTTTFCLWLIGDVIAWTSSDYDLISAVWSSLDLLNILFFVFGTYFFAVLANEEDLPLIHKILFIIITLPAWWITFDNQSISVMYQPVCEALNNDLYMDYKLFAEILAIIYILYLTIRKSLISPISKKVQLVTVAIGFILFFITFGVTEYFAGTTGIYEINLYGLFILPVFMFLIVYAITNLHVFNLRLIGSQLLSYTLIILVGSQFFFLESSSDKALTAVTFVLALGFAVLLIRNARLEVLQREKIEKLAGQLENLVHFISHEVKGALGKSRATFAEILEGDYGDAPPPMKELVSSANNDVEQAVNMVMNILRSTDMKKDKLKPVMEKMDLKSCLLELIEVDKKDAELKGLKFDVQIQDNTDFFMLGDKELITKHVLNNLLSNAITYTPKGNIDVSLSKTGKKLLLSIKDSGVGITSEDMSNLFTEGGRGKDSVKVNVHSTGYGLYFAKQIVTSHNGKIWAESEGQGKGSTFFVEFDAIS